MFIGYPEGQKGYKLYDLKSHRTYTSRNVTFVEHKFPFGDHYEGHRFIENNHLVDCTPYVNYEIRDTSHPENEVDVGKGAQSPNISTNTTDDESRENHKSEIDVEGSQDNNNDKHFTPSATVRLEENVPRQSARTKVRPKHLNEFITDLPPSLEHPQTITNSSSSTTSQSTVYPLSHFISYDNFTKTHRAFLAAITSTDDPKSFSKATKSQNWREAMSREIQALEENGTWSITELPLGKKAIESK